MDQSEKTAEQLETSYLDPLPTDLALLTAKASHASSLGLDNVDAIIARLERARAQLASPSADGAERASPADTLLPLSSYVKTANNKTAAAHKEWNSAVNKFAKAIDKKFTGPPLPLFPSPPRPTPPPNLHPALLSITSSGSTSSISLPPPPTTFGTPHAISSLNSTIALHLARLGAFNSLAVFLDESSTPPLPPSLLASLQDLHLILADLRQGICTSALTWIASHSSPTDPDPDSDLEFELRKEEYIRLLLAGSDLTSEREPLLPCPSTKLTIPDPHVEAALRYGGLHFRNLLSPSRRELVGALLTAPIYMPFPRLLSSPYASIFAPYVRATGEGGRGTTVVESQLCAVFAAAFLRMVDLPRDSPLSVVTDIGGGGAMARIQKVRAVMKEKKTEWSAVGELPVEIPLPTTRRYHSIFACPVSKEQSTSTNPPMLLPCGHVIARESLIRLARGTPTLKCPYCPIVSHVSAAVRVYF